MVTSASGYKIAAPGRVIELGRRSLVRSLGWVRA